MQSPVELSVPQEEAEFSGVFEDNDSIVTEVSKLKYYFENSREIPLG